MSDRKAYQDEGAANFLIHVLYVGFMQAMANEEEKGGRTDLEGREAVVDWFLRRYGVD